MLQSKRNFSKQRFEVLCFIDLLVRISILRFSLHWFFVCFKLFVKKQKQNHNKTLTHTKKREMQFLAQCLNRYQVKSVCIHFECVSLLVSLIFVCLCVWKRNVERERKLGEENYFMSTGILHRSSRDHWIILKKCFFILGEKNITSWSLLLYVFQKSIIF